MVLNATMPLDPSSDHSSEVSDIEKSQSSKPRSRCCGILPSFENVKSWSKRKKIIMVSAISLPIVALAVGLSVGLTVGRCRDSSASLITNSTLEGPPTSQGPNATINSDSLKTWWHETGVIAPQAAVSNEDVRQSHLYTVQVASSKASNDFYNSFVYETIPRNGMGKACHPSDPTMICNEQDGITIEPDIGVTMAWSQFLYGADSVVKVSKRDGSPIAASNVTIRPTTLDFHTTESNGSLLITVPYTPETNGVRFSVEFEEDMWEYRNMGGANDSAYYIQNVNSTGLDYVQSYSSSNPIVGREPQNALLIFASPMPSRNHIPSTDQTKIFEVQPGLIGDLSQIDKPIVAFKPGVYYCTGSSHMNLSSAVNWVHFAPGAYVKGAVEYHNGKDPLMATGAGVLSGEQYVYQANMAQDYSNVKSDEDSVKMWRGTGVTAGQSWTLNGVTMNSPPFNSMDFYGETDSFTVDVSDYKQVGGYFSQTDGLQMYPKSHVRDVFYHNGDDTVKTYYSNVLAERIIVWKTNNGAVVQMGWAPRTISNVTVQDLDVIHSRYHSWLSYAPRTLIGSSSSYDNVTASDTADLSTTISDYTVANLRAEGISPSLISLHLMSNLDNMVVQNTWIEELTPDVVGISTSNVIGFTDNGGDKVNMEGNGLDLKNYTVGTDEISFGRQNWVSNQTGGIYVDPHFDGKWNIS